MDLEISKTSITQLLNMRKCQVFAQLGSLIFTEYLRFIHLSNLITSIKYMTSKMPVIWHPEHCVK